MRCFANIDGKGPVLESLQSKNSKVSHLSLPRINGCSLKSCSRACAGGCALATLAVLCRASGFFFPCCFKPQSRSRSGQGRSVTGMRARPTCAHCVLDQTWVVPKGYAGAPFPGWNRLGANASVICLPFCSATCFPQAWCSQEAFSQDPSE